MEALKNNALFNIDKKKINLPPFWKFYLSDLLKYIKKDIDKEFKINSQVELINKKDISFHSLDFFNNKNYAKLAKAVQKNCHLIFELEHLDANKLINLLHGSRSVDSSSRSISMLDEKQIDHFIQLILHNMNQVMLDKKQKLEFQLDSSIVNESHYGICLAFQIEYIVLKVYIPESLFRFNIIS